MIITVCGSMTFAHEMGTLKHDLELLGHSAILPKEIHRYSEKNDVDNKQEKIELDVIRVYFDEIKRGDCILVYNKTKNNIDNYVGGNSLIEMAFAYVLNKPIYLLNSIPEIGYRDEIEAMFPIVVEGDLARIIRKK
jgi:hypothetical protein